MSAKQIAPREVMVSFLPQRVPTVDDAVAAYETVRDGAASLWEGIGAAAAAARDRVAEVAGSAGGRAVETIGGPIQALPQVQEFVLSEPHVQLAHLYATLGTSDAFLDAVLGDPDLIAAVLRVVPHDTLVGFLGHPQISADRAERVPGALGDKLPTVVQGLTVGSAMSEPVRAGLRRMLSGMTVDQASIAFEARFAHPLRNLTGTWTHDMITRVWDQLAVLPDQDVSGLTILTTFDAISGGGGFGPSWEAPDVVNTIALGEDNSPASLDRIVRHEIGHAVHAEIPAPINAWLQGEMGFWFYSGTADGYGSFVEDLGGFPSTWVDADGEEQTFEAAHRDMVLEMLRTFVGDGSAWTPSRGAVDEGAEGIEARVWAAMPEAVRNACEQSTAYWYANYANWQTGSKGQYFLNYWYARPFWMSADARAVVDAIGDSYTSMSEKEFFAEAYAEYFTDPAGYADPSRWGGSLPASVKDFFAKCIVDRQPYEPPEPAAAEGRPAPPGPTGMADTP